MASTTTTRPPRLRRWLQFRLSSLLWAAVVAGVALGWWRDHQHLRAQIDRPYNSGPHWETAQVLGRPDTTGAGDIPTAWASATPDGQQEWLLLDYPRYLRPTAVVIHETYNPGAVYKVSSVSLLGEEILWTGNDPTPRTAARGVSVIQLAKRTSMKRIKIYIDSPSVPGWNEIDAVGLRDASGKIYWATAAQASSSYGAQFTSQGSGGYYSPLFR